MIAPPLPKVGLSVKQAEEMLGLPRRYGYHEIKVGKLRAFRDSQGLLKVDPDEVYRYANEEKSS